MEAESGGGGGAAKMNRAQRRQAKRAGKKGGDGRIRMTPEMEDQLAEMQVERIETLMADFIGARATRTRLAQNVTPDLHNIDSMFANIHQLSKALSQQARTRALLDRLIAAIRGACDGMLLCMLTNLSEMLQIADDENCDAWSPTMCAAGAVASLMRLLRERVPPPGSPLPPFFADMIQGVGSDVQLCAAGLCADAGRSVADYTVCDILDAIEIVSIRWHMLRLPLAKLLGYAKGLLHRALVIMSQPQSRAVIDNPLMARAMERPPGAADDDDDDDDVEVTVGSNGVRCMCNPLFKIIGVIHTLMGTPEETPISLLLAEELARDREEEDDDSDDDDDEEDAAGAATAALERAQARLAQMAAATRQYLIARADEVGSSANAKTDIGFDFSRSAIKAGDVDAFYSKSKLGAPQPRKVLMVAKSPLAQQAWALIFKFLRVGQVVRVMREEEPDYFLQWTYYEHLYNLLTKSYLLEFAFRDMRAKFRGRYCVWGNDVVYQLGAICRDAEPVVVEIMGRTMVFHRRRRYTCASFEEAVVVWCLLIERDLGGQLNSRSAGPAFDHILGRGRHDVVAKKAHPWLHNTVVHL